MKRFIFRNSFSFLIFWILFIFVLCATPGQYIPSTDWLELLSFDKFVHASLFFILATLTFITALKYKKPTPVLVTCFLMCVAYGALLEFMQATCFSNRSADWKDMVANTFGCVMALLTLKKIKFFISLQNSP